MDALVNSLMEELNCETVFTIPIFGGIPIYESVVVTWIIMAVVIVLCILLTRNLSVEHPGRRQIILETAVNGLNNFFRDTIGENGKQYIPYLMTVAIYIGIANLIGLLGFKPPTKDMNVTAALSLMSIILIEMAGIRGKGTKGWLKSFAEPMPVVLPINILEEHLKAHKNNKLFVLGELGRHYFEQRGIEIDKQFHYTVQNPTLNRARNIAEELLELNRKEELDEVYIIYTSMVNAIQEETQIRQLLPLKKASFNVKLPADIPMEELALKPSPEAVMDRIVPDYVVGFIYGALVESYSCEQNARMMAMEAATKSAKDMLHELDILYNRARQAAITQEITEVIAGAKAQKRKKRQ